MRATFIEALTTLALVMVVLLSAYVAGGSHSVSIAAIATLCIVLCRHLYWIGQVIHWIQAPPGTSPPMAIGAWAEVFNHLYAQARKASKETR